MGASEQSNHTPDPSPNCDAQYIASLDLGTTTLRCFIYNRKAQLCGRAEEKVTLLYPAPGRVEMDPEELWSKFMIVMSAAISNAGVSPGDIRCLGLSTQRATFITWDRRTGVPFHNFITWKDIRADALVRHWNSCLTMKVVRFGSSLLYLFLRSKRYLAASVLKFMNIQVNMRLKWVLENNEMVKHLADEGHVMFGTIDTWLVYRLTEGKVHATDYSNASGTALYDPYLEEWSTFFLKLLQMPKSLFPELRDSVGDWGMCSARFFGVPIPITAVVSDQGASLFGSCSFERGDVKVTLGTGAFLDVNTGSKVHTSVKGIYPVHGWKDKDGLVHMAEASSNDNGTVIEWGQMIGLYEKASETSELASSVKGSEGVFFIPGFQGIQAPVNDTTATGGFLGLSASTTRAHLVRAMLESLAFRIYQIYRAMLTEADHELLSLRVDGGVAQNDFLVQMIATLTGRPVERPKSTEVSALGAAFLAGMGAGIWKSRKELIPLREVEKTFHPQLELQDHLLNQMKQWEKALHRCTKWHSKSGLNRESKALKGNTIWEAVGQKKETRLLQGWEGEGDDDLPDVNHFIDPWGSGRGRRGSGGACAALIPRGAFVPCVPQLSRHLVKLLGVWFSLVLSQAMAMEAQAQSKNLENVKKEPQTPKANENSDNANSFRGGGRGGRGGFRGNRGGGGGRGGGPGSVQTSTPVPGGIGSLGATNQGIPGGIGSLEGGRGGAHNVGRGGAHHANSTPGHAPNSNAANNADARPDHHRGGGGGGGYYRGGRGGRGRGGGGGGGGYGGDRGDRGQDRIIERLKQLAGPLIDLPPREETVRKFSNHCRLWVGNLPLDIKEDDVRELFKPFGEYDEVYFDKNKGFAFVRMDYKSNAEKARQELHMKDYKGRQLKIRFSSPGTALKIRNLSTWVTNELLEKAFSVFGELEKAIVITDERGRATGDGIVEFCKKPSANLALKKCNEGCFFMVASPRPVIVEQMALVDDNEGMSEININKRNPEYVKERQQGPRFAHPGSFEYEYGLKWKQLYELFDKKRDALEKELQDEKRKLEEQIEYAKYEHETEMLREQLRQREEMNQRTKSDYEARQREWEEHRRTEEERQRRQEEELSQKFRQQEEELRRRQEENRLFMQERANDLMKNENSQDSFGSSGYPGNEGSNWRRNSDGYRSQGGSSWRGGGSDNWGRSGMGSRGGTGSSGMGSSWDSSWDGRPDPWQSDNRSGYQRGGNENELPPPPVTYYRGRNAGYRRGNRLGLVT
ncbi:hypothetical protein O3P69_016676 [Scylla paramamosain]|uniref:Glycerol kinase 5 n=1 Tax=Scylla paramamosain TaxID=85552 RepID=A0AAW0SYK5_SCYPA